MTPSFDMPDAIIVAHPRSGTHFLESAMASHPTIRPRGECFLRYKRQSEGSTRPIYTTHENAFSNKPGRTNIGILMYYVVPFFEASFGPLKEHRLIHLLRDPLDIAYSAAQMRANQNFYKDRYIAHYREGQVPPPHQPFDRGKAQEAAEEIRAQQERYTLMLRDYPRVLTVDYDKITEGKQVNEFPASTAASILSFLDLDDAPLSTSLLKTRSQN